jgi:hypothetical protein
MAGHDAARTGAASSKRWASLYRKKRTICREAVGLQGGRRVSLPTHPFQHERFCLEARGPSRGTEAPNPRRAETAHPLLDDRLGGKGASFEVLLSLERFAFLDHHPRPRTCGFADRPPRPSSCAACAPIAASAWVRAPSAGAGEILAVLWHGRPRESVWRRQSAPRPAPRRTARRRHGAGRVRRGVAQSPRSFWWCAAIMART